MKKFIKTCLLFISCFMLTVLLLGLGYAYVFKISMQDIPALNFSDSYSFNKKVRFMKAENKNASVLVLGSSMSLNNVHSATVCNHFKTENYLNASSWGMSMNDDYHFLKIIQSIYKIEYLIISSNAVDFQKNEKHISYAFTEDYLSNNTFNTLKDFIYYFDLKYYERNFRYAKKVRNCINEYEYLNYDAYGAVNFKKEYFNIDSIRWKDDCLSNPLSKLQYKYLDSISAYCAKNNIKLIFIQSPYREGISKKMDSSKRNLLNTHIKQVKGIIESHNQTFINSTDKNWSDSLFTDAIHFNEEGAKLFTEFSLNKTQHTSTVEP